MNKVCLICEYRSMGICLECQIIPKRDVEEKIVSDYSDEALKIIKS